MGPLQGVHSPEKERDPHLQGVHSPEKEIRVSGSGAPARLPTPTRSTRRTEREKEQCLNKGSVHLSVQDFVLFYLDYVTSREKKKQKKEMQVSLCICRMFLPIFYTFKISLEKKIKNKKIKSP